MSDEMNRAASRAAATNRDDVQARTRDMVQRLRADPEARKWIEMLAFSGDMAAVEVAGDPWLDVWLHVQDDLPSWLGAVGDRAFSWDPAPVAVALAVAEVAMPAACGTSDDSLPASECANVYAAVHAAQDWLASPSDARASKAGEHASLGALGSRRNAWWVTPALLASSHRRKPEGVRWLVEAGRQATLILRRDGGTTKVRAACVNGLRRLALDGLAGRRWP